MAAPASFTHRLLIDIKGGKKMHGQENQTAELMARFNQVFQTHDPADLSALVAEGCVIENTAPAPDGSRHVGRAACIELWSSIATNPELRFDLEDTIICGERAMIFWKLHWGPSAAEAVRGVNLMRVRDGLIVEARGYVKGA
jgi:hypothetical protein